MNSNLLCSIICFVLFCVIFISGILSSEDKMYSVWVISIGISILIFIISLIIYLKGGNEEISKTFCWFGIALLLFPFAIIFLFLALLFGSALFIAEYFGEIRETNIKRLKEIIEYNEKGG